MISDFPHLGDKVGEHKENPIITHAMKGMSGWMTAGEGREKSIRKFFL